MTQNKALEGVTLKICRIKDTTYPMWNLEKIKKEGEKYDQNK